MDEPVGVFLDGPMPALATFANLCSIRNDLWVVEELCNALSESHPAVSGELPDHLKPRAYWECAVVTYGRCFKGGRSHFRPGQTRGVPNAVLAQLTEDEMETHRWALHERDKHIAHRVDAEGERVTVAAQLEGDDVKIVWSAKRAVTPPADRCAALGRLAVRLKGLLADHAKRAESKILDSVRESLPMFREIAGPIWERRDLRWGPYLERDP